MNTEVVNFIKEHKGDLLENWMAAMKISSHERSLNLISDDVFKDISHEFIEVAVSNIIDSENGFNQKVERFTERVVRIGWELVFLMDGLSTLKTLVLELMQKEKDYSSEEVIELITEIDRWVAPMTNQIIESYSNNWEKTVSLQKVALQELSAPLIPVFEKISVMPLVGTIDTDRARLIMENLLSGVVKHRSEVVLIDITGVPVVDTMVAHHIIQAADAVRLVGSRCMLVGIRPEIAQTIVNLGINLNQITTTSTLQKGIEKAMEFTNRKIVVLKEGKD
ncbi:STAS domain-containing protein [Siminovitchia fortis]|uniref:STAS domain-containing protein n=1 Tax=Siminovitchia fortis TaxID=254758 RepID=A0A443IJL3_9BACI|nr:STAS domain-containing protein [Siminovitchia fortis]RWR04313.1 STAS domain-containing protein [Siminovitchia fortis]WHY80942.1 STAS domain-containing protein [Siminovitchia fortis]